MPPPSGHQPGHQRGFSCRQGNAPHLSRAAASAPHKIFLLRGGANCLLSAASKWTNSPPRPAVERSRHSVNSSGPALRASIFSVAGVLCLKIEPVRKSPTSHLSLQAAREDPKQKNRSTVGPVRPSSNSRFRESSSCKVTIAATRAPAHQRFQVTAANCEDTHTHTSTHTFRTHTPEPTSPPPQPTTPQTHHTHHLLAPPYVPASWSDLVIGRHTAFIPSWLRSRSAENTHPTDDKPDRGPAQALRYGERVSLFLDLTHCCNPCPSLGFSCWGFFSFSLNSLSISSSTLSHIPRRCQCDT